ncbi:MAG: hypothetical protein ACR2GY_07580 [Phycisphaerales bacterium]
MSNANSQAKPLRSSLTSSQNDMHAVTTALLADLIDYAGLFPPAALDMPTMTRSYAEHLASEHAWMLSRVIVPVARLSEFEVGAETVLPRKVETQESHETSQAEPWRISAITASPSDPAAFQTDLDRIDAFNSTHADGSLGCAVIDTIETKITSTADIERALDSIPDHIFPFFELPLDRDVRGMLAALAGDGGGKIRTGGLEPSLFPTVETVAHFIRLAALADAPFKATAGMHHPLRHVSTTVSGATEHGFLNVFIAAALAHSEGIDEATITTVLSETSLDAFTFSDAAIVWRDEYRLDADALEAARLAFAVSFGSCSFDEPIADLKQLGVL